MRAFSPAARIGKFDLKDPTTLARQLSILESALQSQSQNDANSTPYTVTDKQTGTYNARPWDLVRADTSSANVYVVLPDPIKNLGVWVAVKFCAGQTNHTVVVSAINATIDADTTFVMNVARQFIEFYATVDGWERASTV